MAPEQIHIRIARLDQPLSQAVFGSHLDALPGSLRDELRAYKRWQDAQASLAGKLMLQRLLRDLQLPGSLFDLRTGHKDRPFISDNFDFNISHSGGLVLLALSTFSRVGIDVEKHRPLDPGLFRKYFSDSEWAQLDPADPLPAFFRLWSIKEAAIKCDGRGVEVLGKTTVLDDEHVRCGDAVWTYRMIDAGSGSAAALCSSLPASGIDLQATDPF